MSPRRSPSQPRSVLWRYIHRGRIRWAMPNLLIEETPEQVVSLIVPGVVSKAPKDFRHELYVEQLVNGWELDDWVWHTRRILKMTRFDARHSFELHWDHASGAFMGWYVNLQEPLRRSPFGYDTFDQMLDIWIEPDGTWSWKDAHELPEAEAAGIFTPAEVAAIWAEGRRVIDRLDSLIPTGWEAWQPDPAWSLPTLPEGWDRIDDVIVRQHGA